MKKIATKVAEGVILYAVALQVVAMRCKKVDLSSTSRNATQNKE